MNKLSIALLGYLLIFFSVCYSSHTFPNEKITAAQQLLATKITTPQSLDILWEAAIIDSDAKYVAKIIAAYMETASDPRLDLNDIVLAAFAFGNEKHISHHAEALNQIITKYRALGLLDQFNVASAALWSLGTNAQSTLFYPLNETVVLTVYAHISKSQHKQLNEALIKMMNVNNLALYGSRMGQCG